MALCSFAALTLPAPASAQIAISVRIGPPALPVYEQPPCPGEGYIWTPGYWAYADDYYWVPGTWVLAPQVGFLWDATVVGLGRWYVPFPHWLLGTAYRLLWWDQL